MGIETLRVLMVEDSESDTSLVTRELRRGARAVEVRRVDDPESLREALRRERWDVVLSDWSMPSFGALEALAILKESDLDLPFIIVSGTVGEEMAVEAIRAGAHDYLLKDRLKRLLPAIERELREARARRERGQLEDQLRQSQKMEAIGQLAGGVAHDFNNILVVILAELELLRRRIGPNDAASEQVEQIGDAAARAAALTRQLLAFSRRGPQNLHVVSVNAVVEEAEKLLRRVLGEHVRVSTALDKAPVTVEADPDRLGQVLLNLAVNARDAMPDGGALTIGTSRVSLNGALASTLRIPSGSYVALTVTDTGCGMDEGIVAHIFEPFFTTKEPGKGTGLGLSTVLNIVRESRGGIAVRSVPQRGTTFTVYLPFVDVRVHSAAPTATVSGSDAGRESILVVEDEPQVRTSLVRLLSSMGYTVIEAANAQAALEVLRDMGGAVDLVITDLVMPGMDGRSLAARLVEFRHDLKVVFMSGFADRTGDPLVGGDDCFLKKPFTVAELTRVVRRALG